MMSWATSEYLLSLRRISRAGYKESYDPALPNWQLWTVRRVAFALSPKIQKAPRGPTTRGHLRRELQKQRGSHFTVSFGSSCLCPLTRTIPSCGAASPGRVFVTRARTKLSRNGRHCRRSISVQSFTPKTTHGPWRTRRRGADQNPIVNCRTAAVRVTELGDLLSVHPHHLHFSDSSGVPVGHQ